MSSSTSYIYIYYINLRITILNLWKKESIHNPRHIKIVLTVIVTSEFGNAILKINEENTYTASIILSETNLTETEEKLSFTEDKVIPQNPCADFLCTFSSFQTYFCYEEVALIGPPRWPCG